MQTQVEYVGFWARVLASLVDTLVVVIVLTPVEFLLFHRQTGLSTVIVLGGTIALWVRYGATPGKMLIGAVVVDERTLAAPTVPQAIVRWLGYFLSSIFLLGFIWVAFSSKKQGWHDLIARTVVVRKSSMPQALEQALE